MFILTQFIPAFVRWLQRDINKSIIIFLKFEFKFELLEFEFEFEFKFEFEFEFELLWSSSSSCWSSSSSSVHFEPLLGEIYEEPVDTCATETFHTNLMESYIVFASFQTSTTTSTVLQKQDTFTCNGFNCNFNPIFGSNTSKFQLFQNYAKKYDGLTIHVT